MVLQTIGVVASVIGILTFIWKVASFVRQRALTPKGYADVLAGLAVVMIVTLAVAIIAAVNR